MEVVEVRIVRRPGDAVAGDIGIIGRRSVSGVRGIASVRHHEARAGIGWTLVDDVKR
jgi:hypothetical protein